MSSANQRFTGWARLLEMLLEWRRAEGSALLGSSAKRMCFHKIIHLQSSSRGPTEKWNLSQIAGFQESTTSFILSHSLFFSNDLDSLLLVMTNTLLLSASMLKKGFKREHNISGI